MGLFRFQAQEMPMMVPMIKLMIVASPMRLRLQGIATFRTSDTGVGNLEIEMPKSPLSRFNKYFPY